LSNPGADPSRTIFTAGVLTGGLVTDAQAESPKAALAMSVKRNTRVVGKRRIIRE
jgi:hypothetical protein